jgi:hypothetical protein
LRQCPVKKSGSDSIEKSGLYKHRYLSWTGGSVHRETPHCFSFGSIRSCECSLEGAELFYWREGDKEVDFVIRQGRSLTSNEVKAVADRDVLPGIADFSKASHPKRMLLVGSSKIDEEFLTTPIPMWIA